MKVITCNVNGIRSASTKGLWPWLAAQDADLICLQEVRAKVEHLPASAAEMQGYHAYFNLAEKPGYSGVALYAKRQPTQVTRTFGLPVLEDEGRYLQLDFERLTVISAYFPSGSSGPLRQHHKYDFLDHMALKLEQFRKVKREFILCGDLNIAHQEIDLKNWRGNIKNSGFLPLERAWMSMILDRLDYVDAFRVINKNPDQYTWWSNRGAAYAKNVGWRIDYQIVSPGLKALVRAASIYTETRFSDHAPLTIDYDLERY